MKNYRPILSSVFALLVLFSSTNFMVGIHLCSGSVQKVAWFSPAEKCAMEKKMPPCHRHQSKSCCEDESIVHDVQDFKETISEVNIAAPSAFIVDKPAVPVAEIIPSSLVSITPFAGYDPPLPVTDLSVDFQVFLI